MTPFTQAILPHALPFLVVLARLSGLFILAPMLSGQSLPARVRGMLAVVFAAIVYPALPAAAHAPVHMDMIGLAGLCAGEIAIGFCIGLICALPVVSVQMGGRMVGQQMGLALANVFNPAVDDEADVIGQMFLYIALSAFIVLGGLEHMQQALVRSFDHVPPGGFSADMAPLDLVVGLVSAGMHLAVRIAAPVLCILTLEMLLSGFIMKTVPQLNILTFGFPLKILGGLTALSSALYFIAEAIGLEVELALGAMQEWVESLSMTW